MLQDQHQEQDFKIGSRDVLRTLRAHGAMYSRFDPAHERDGRMDRWTDPTVTSHRRYIDTRLEFSQSICSICIQQLLLSLYCNRLLDAIGLSWLACCCGWDSLMHYTCSCCPATPSETFRQKLVIPSTFDTD